MAVVISRCGCCGEQAFVENEEAYRSRMVRGEAAFCQACMDLPDEVAEAAIEVQAAYTHIERMVVLGAMIEEARAAMVRDLEWKTARQAAT